MAEPNDWNAKIIQEFRANGGRVGGNFEGAPLLLLHTTGAKTGQERVNPMMYRKIDGGYAVFASKAGAPTNPDWYHNLVANPSVQAEIGTTDRGADGAGGRRCRARGDLEPRRRRSIPVSPSTRSMTTRQIPVVILEPSN